MSVKYEVECAAAEDRASVAVREMSRCHRLWQEDLARLVDATERAEKADAECATLRADLAAADANAVNLEHERDELRAEVERLRAELRDGDYADAAMRDSHHTLDAACGELQAEVERLVLINQSLAQRVQDLGRRCSDLEGGLDKTTQAHAERCTELDQVRAEVDRTAGSVRRLLEDRCALESERATLRAEVERTAKQSAANFVRANAAESSLAAANELLGQARGYHEGLDVLIDTFLAAQPAAQSRTIERLKPRTVKLDDDDLTPEESAYLHPAPPCTEAEQRVLDAMANVSLETLQYVASHEHISTSLSALAAPCAAELARRQR